MNCLRGDQLGQNNMNYLRNVATVRGSEKNVNNSVSLYHLCIVFYYSHVKNEGVKSNFVPLSLSVCLPRCVSAKRGFDLESS